MSWLCEWRWKQKSTFFNTNLIANVQSKKRQAEVEDDEVRKRIDLLRAMMETQPEEGKDREEDMTQKDEANEPQKEEENEENESEKEQPEEEEEEEDQ